MKRLLLRLDSLCIEVISININRYSRISEEYWGLLHCNNFGEKLIFSTLLNNKIDDKAFNFILNNFYVQNMKLYSKIYKKIEYFDILNGKNFNKLEIELTKDIKLKNNLKFNLTTDILIFSFGENCNDFIDSKQFFTNLYVKKDIQICLNFSSTRVNVEEILLILLKNTSKEIENVQIRKYLHPSNNFLECFLDILKEKKHLKNLNIYLNNEETSKMMLLFFLLKTSLGDSGSIKLESLERNRNYNEYSNMFNCIKNLDISFQVVFPPHDKLKKFFSSLKSLTLKNLKKLNIGYYFCEKLPEEVNEFFENCSNLCSMKLNFIPSFQTILPCAKSLKTLHLSVHSFDYKIEGRELENFISQSSLEEFGLELNIEDEKRFFKEIQLLGNLQNTLTKLEFSFAFKLENSSKYFSKLVGKFHKLTFFKLIYWSIEEEVLVDIFRSLLPSNQTLREIIFLSDNYSTPKILDCFELFKLLNSCDKLKIAILQFKIEDEKIPELLSVFKKFQSTLEEVDFRYFWNDNYFRDYLDFFSGCSSLKKISGLPNINQNEELLESFINSRYSLVHANFTEETLSNYFQEFFTLKFPSNE